MVVELLGARGDAIHSLFAAASNHKHEYRLPQSMQQYGSNKVYFHAVPFLWGLARQYREAGAAVYSFDACLMLSASATFTMQIKLTQAEYAAIREIRLTPP